MKNHHWLWIIGGVVVLYIVYAEFFKSGNFSLSALTGSSATATGS